MNDNRWTNSILILPAVCGLLAVIAAVAWMLSADGRALGLLLATGQLVGGTIAISLPLGAMAGLLLFRTELPGRRLALGMLVVMLLVPLYLQVAGWDAGFGKQGWCSLFTESLGQPPLRGLRGAVWVHAMAAIPWVAVMVGVSLRYVEPELEEQVLLESGQAGVLRWVVFPRVLPALGVATLWVAVSTAGEMTVADMYLVPTYARELYTGTALGDDWTSVTRQILPGSALVLTSVAAALVVAAYLTPPAGRVSERPPRRMRLGLLKWPACAAVMLLVSLVAIVPLGNLIYKAGMTVQQVDGQFVRAWSATAFCMTLAQSPRRFADNHVWTILIGGGTAITTLLIAVPLAWWARRPTWRAFPAVIAIAIGFAVPAPLLALMLIGLLDQPGAPFLIWLYDDTLFAPIVTLTARALPLTLLIAWYGVRSVSQDVMDSALVDGADCVRRFLAIVIPQRMSVWLLAGLLAFVLASGDLAASILVVPPGVMTVAIRVFGLIHAGVDDQVAGICLTTAVAYVLLAAASIWLARRMQPHGW